MLKKIASAYLSSIQEEFAKSYGGDFAFKTAFEDDIEDYIVDYWQISNKSALPSLLKSIIYNYTG